jgi:DNA-binding transcriptional LysR family regulator
MDVRHLSVFVAVAQEMSFTRAADSLLLAQSAVSTTVRELERELGVELFDRSHRQIRLTGAGRSCSCAPGAGADARDRRGGRDGGDRTAGP